MVILHFKHHGFFFPPLMKWVAGRVYNIRIGTVGKSSYLYREL